VITVAGDGPVDFLIPELAMYRTGRPDRRAVERALAGVDLVLVENLCSLPLNPGASEVVADLLRSRPAVMHHHDLAWQRVATSAMPPPPDDEAWLHVTINDLSRVQLAERGISATVMRNRFEMNPLPGDRTAMRSRLGIVPDEILVVQPTRAIPRKNVPGGIALAQAIGATYWLLGRAEDGYETELDRILSSAGTPVIWGSPDGKAVEMSDAYAACDVVTMPSFWEGFGNPSVESAVYRRPLAIGPYPVAAELEAFGFDWFALDESGRLAGWLVDRDEALLNHNLEVASREFALADLPDRLGDLFKTASWSSW
jgi:mannosylglucosylglycerate synthase